MTTSSHIFIFILSSAAIWFFAGLLIDSIDRVARHFHKTSFSISFFVLGFLTSISEISVAINSTATGAPQISAGNLVGASFVALLLIVPFLAIMGNGIDLKKTVSKRNMILALLAVVFPIVLSISGNLTVLGGLFAVLIYAVLIYSIYHQPESQQIKETSRNLISQKEYALKDLLKILAGGIAIFIAGYFLVDEAVYFSQILGVPGSLIGLVLLSLGTNVPEIVIAARSILKKHKEIAFGDYLGSATANTLIFGGLVLVNGGFLVEKKEFLLTAPLMVLGLTLLYLFSQSKKSISRKEGLFLIIFYFIFLAGQIIYFIK